MAEIASHTLHNVYTLRGAKIRDALAWSRHINEAIHLFGARHGRRLLVAPLADLGERRGHPLPQGPARPLPLHPRRDAAPREPRLRPGRDRRDGRAARRHRAELRQPRLLRLGQPQRQGGLHLLPRLLRREPGDAPPAAAGRGRPQGRRVHGRRRRRPRPGPRRLREGRVPLGRPGGQLRGVRRPGQRRRRASSRRTPSSSWATRPRTAPGATSTSRRPRSCATGSS